MKGDRRSQRSSPTCVIARPENTPVGWPVIVEDEACEWHLTGVLQSSIRLTATRVSTEPASPACSTDLDGIPNPKQDARPHADRSVNGRNHEDWAALQVRRELFFCKVPNAERRALRSEPLRRP